MALNADRNTPLMDAELIAVPMAANAVIHAGGMVVANASGHGAPGSTATGLTYLGRAERAEDNTGGADGAKQVLVRRGLAFRWANDGGDPVTQASLGKSCYIVDDETVAASNGAGTRSAAGIVVGIEADGVWVQ